MHKTPKTVKRLTPSRKYYIEIAEELLDGAAQKNEIAMNTIRYAFFSQAETAIEKAQGEKEFIYHSTQLSTTNHKPIKLKWQWKQINETHKMLV